MNNNILKTSAILSIAVLFIGCSKNEPTVIKKDTNYKNIRTIVEHKNDVKSKVIPPKALRATVYPYETNEGTFIDKHEVYYWVSLPKFGNKKIKKEQNINKKIISFIED